MPNKMLIDASHPEETRVVVVRGNRIEEFDFESENKKQLKGNIYLARVTRVEPSLQAAFVEYGGNRHGFLAFSEIHPDYYQIPVADRQALLRAEAEDAEADEDEDDGEERNGRHRRRRRGRSRDRNGETAHPDGESENVSDDDGAHDETAASEDAGSDDADSNDAGVTVIAETAEADVISEAAPETIETEAAQADEDPSVDTSPVESEAASDEPAASDDEQQQDDESGDDSHDDDSHDNGDGADEVVSVGAEDAFEEVHEERRRPSRRQYKIQEVIKRRQILLVQVVKEERGNKGAALTTYLSLAGRYSVLMPNTARGGGISRKITNAQDRKRLKDIVKELEVPQGMGVILRTAGESRTKTEIKRDYEYLMRLWDNVRELTLKSTAPALVYEEGSLIKRSVRDLYNKDINEILVAGEAGYREAKDFMRMLMPSHAKVVQPYRDTLPIFARNGIEAQLDKMVQPQVTLKSGGYIILNQTEALVAIDVNSGRSTKEHSIEDTALQTNLEAAEEVARQLRLRDLAGLIVIDFIDMEESRNNRAVEKRLKECLKNDRARIQVGRISHFGLLEMSRQRIRASVLESTMQICPHCGGAGHVRSESSVGLMVIRAIEDFLLKDSRCHITVRTPTATALYILNHKRSTITDLENRFGLSITIEADESVRSQHYAIMKGAAAERPEGFVPIMPALNYEEYPEDDIIDFEIEEEDEEETTTEVAAAPAQEENGGQQKRKRRRRRRGGRDRENGDSPRSGASDASDDSNDDAASDEASADGEGEAAAASENGAEDGSEPKKRRRGKRGGRRNRREDEEAAAASTEDEAAEAGEATAETSASEDDAQVADKVVQLEEPSAPAFEVETPVNATDAPVVDADVAAMETVEGATEETAPEAASSEETAPVAEEAPKKRTTRRRTKKVEPAAAEVSEAVADLAAPAEPSEVVAEKPKPRRTTRRKKVTEEAAADAPEAVVAEEAVAAVPTEAVSAIVEAEPVAETPKGEVEPSPATETEVEAAAAADATAEPAADQPAAAPIASEPVVTSSAPEGEETQPRKGWWQRRGFF
ncbi:Rne/Rng family ribonuclease [Aquamicrobium zhengzhouense]|uniref:Ribonuclease E n=1 Tax=Aquamicrobium zhengzhouense TaxID=2781738 RepID=A0ABS0SBE7_9HYPH|nr:ribonuclease E/G [Aquamicrobium zhengzhouense]MBI1620586.1 Rne/Rng family ribonuclease [Aquamicrobium zhengzhouense]